MYSGRKGYCAIFAPKRNFQKISANKNFKIVKLMEAFLNYARYFLKAFWNIYMKILTAIRTCTKKVAFWCNPPPTRSIVITG